MRNFPTFAGRRGWDPDRPHILPPSTYRVVDGDTLAVPTGGLRIRLRAVATPERARSTWPHDPLVGRTLKVHGIERTGPRRPLPAGEKARAVLGQITAGYALLVLPSGRDRYGRITADIVRSATPGETFEPLGAVAVEHLLLRQSAAEVFSRKKGEEVIMERLPPEYPFGYAQDEEPSL